MILCIETATEICSVCISNNGKLISLKESNQQYDHAARITLLIRECLKEATISLEDLDAIAISRGPGSYTALRVGTAVAKGICYPLEKPLIEIDTLQAIAWGTREKEGLKVFYSPMIDARRMEVYRALFDSDLQNITAPEAVIIECDSLSPWLGKGNQIICSGNGAEKCREVLSSEQVIFSDVLCSAAFMVDLATKKFQSQQFADPAYYSPFYLKPPNITTPRKWL